MTQNLNAASTECGHFAQKRERLRRRKPAKRQRPDTRQGTVQMSSSADGWPTQSRSLSLISQGWLPSPWLSAGSQEEDACRRKGPCRPRTQWNTLGRTRAMAQREQMPVLREWDSVGTGRESLQEGHLGWKESRRNDGTQ